MSDLLEVYSKLPITIAKAKGAYLWDDQNEKYLDFYGGHAVISIGHQNPRYVDSLKSQLEKIAFYSNAIQTPLQEELASKLLSISGLSSYKVFLCNSGAEANENALKISSFHTGKRKFLYFSGAFHGRTAAALAVTDNSRLLAPMHQSVEAVCSPLNDKEAFLETFLKHKEELSGVIIEGIQGIAGIIEPEKDFLSLVDKTCKRYGVSLILDEVQSGAGRTGEFFAFQKAGITPELISLAKGIGNGFPVAVVLANDSISVEKGSIGTTFGGNQLACSAVISVLDEIKNQNTLKQNLILGKYLIGKLKELCVPVKVRGRGLMIGIEFEFPVASLLTSLRNNHKILLGSSSNPFTMRVLPPYCITHSDIDYFIDALKVETLKQ